MPSRTPIPFSAFARPTDGRLAESRNASGEIVEVVHPRIWDQELVDFIRESRAKGHTVMIFPE